MTVVDVGSNPSYYAPLESCLVGPRGRVIAIEPVPQKSGAGKRNIGLNWHSLNPLHWPAKDVLVTAYTLDSLVSELRSTESI